MTERGMAHSDGASACPFVAFEDDRDERSDRPDHRHRCYAEIHPAPRAIAHQEAYCLSSAFAVCPTFQDWAQREAARTRGGAGAAVPPPGATVAMSQADDHRHDTRPGGRPRRKTLGVREPNRPPNGRDRRRKPADVTTMCPHHVSAPEPATGLGGAAAVGNRTGDGQWSGHGRSDRGRQPPPGRPGRVQGVPEPEHPRRRSWPTARRAARRQHGRSRGRRRIVRRAAARPQDERHAPQATRGALRRRPSEPRNPTPSSPASSEAARPSALLSHTSRRRTGRSRPGATRGCPATVAAPEPRPERRPVVGTAATYEAYPTIKTRAAIPGLPRLAVMAAALGIAALALFFLPSILDLFGGSAGAGRRQRVAGAQCPVESVVPSPTVPPAPTPQVYIVRSGDTMSKIAKRFDISIDELIAANKDGIKDPDKISIGDTVIIPVPVSEEATGVPRERAAREHRALAQAPRGRRAASAARC